LGSDVAVEISEHCAVLRINNPPVNLLHPRVADQIARATSVLATDSAVRCIIITGTGRHFVAGGDLHFVRSLDAATAEAYVLDIQRMQLALRQLPQPVIAAVNGPALGGGCELAMACDIRISAPDALWGQPEVTLGIIPGAGGTQHLPRLIGAGRAMWLLCSGERITAARALELGLVNEVVADIPVLERARQMAACIASNAPAAVAAAKRAVNVGLQLNIEEAHRFEASLFAPLVETEDFREGAAAFFEKRSAHFSGK
jgi:enoyl-CoA hydratase